MIYELLATFCLHFTGINLSNFVCMCTRSLVSRPNTTLIGLGTTLVHKGNEPHARLARSLPVVEGKVYERHIGKALNSAANL